MANLRPILLISLVFIGYLLWVEWQKDYGPQPTAAATASNPASSTAFPEPVSTGQDLPSIVDAPSVDMPGQPEASTAETDDSVAQRRLIRVETDVLSIAIDPLGGSVVYASLKGYPVDLDEPDIKVLLFNEQPRTYYTAQSGLLSRQAAPNHTTPFQFERDSYTLTAGEGELQVPLRWSDEGGITVTKTFSFQPDSYDIGVSFELDNNSSGIWAGGRYDQLQRAQPEETSGWGFNNTERYSFNGVGFYSPEEKLEKVDFDEAAEQPFQSTNAGGWVAMIQHYFFTAWVPGAEEPNVYSTQGYSPTGWPRVIARAQGPSREVAAGDTLQFNSILYVGPKLQEELPAIADGLDLTVNYGIFTVFSAPLFWLLNKIHSYVGNWGWAIVLLTVLIKLAFFKLTEAQYRSMARMRKLQPRIEKLKERYGDDRQAMSQAMMAMYKEEKVNPLGGCLPILVQIPIFIALYWVLLESVELRQAPFILWIDNLSKPDPYFILPLLNAAFMIATQRLTPMVGMDPMQKKMMQAMPVVFSIMFAFFPAGLVLYWATNAGLSLAQQWYITRKITAE